MAEFEDRFGRQASQYARYRPGYPPELFAYLASVAPDRRLAWDCGTGNGQAARGLAGHFERVVATDASAEQLAQAAPHARIEFRVERAEDLRLEDGSVDLITAATAAHWFDLDSFYRTVRRVAAPNGVLAVWTYHLPRCEPAVDRALSRFYWEVLAGYWPDGFRHVEAHYGTLPFPFEEIRAPEFVMSADWSLEDLAGFLGSWSASQQYVSDHGEDPVALVREELTRAWGETGRRRRIEWPLHLKGGRVR